MMIGQVCGAGEFSAVCGLFPRFSIGRGAEIEPGLQSTFLHGMRSKSG
jgi:hypothetical protein